MFHLRRGAQVHVLLPTPAQAAVLAIHLCVERHDIQIHVGKRRKYHHLHSFSPHQDTDRDEETTDILIPLVPPLRITAFHSSSSSSFSSSSPSSSSSLSLPWWELLLRRRRYQDEWLHEEHENGLEELNVDEDMEVVLTLDNSMHWVRQR